MSVTTLEITTPTSEQELQQLPGLIQSWKQVREELQTLEDHRKELKARIRVLEEVIMRIMKKHEIGALDLKNTGGRLVYEKKQAKAGLAIGTLQKLLSDHLQSDEKAKEALTYITEHRESRVKERLFYEK